MTRYEQALDAARARLAEVPVCILKHYQGFTCQGSPCRLRRATERDIATLAFFVAFGNNLPDGVLIHLRAPLLDEYAPGPKDKRCWLPARHHAHGWPIPDGSGGYEFQCDGRAEVAPALAPELR